MQEFIIKLILANLTGDFLLQPASLVRKKEKWYFGLLHVGIHAIILMVLFRFSMQYWLGFLIILVTHYFIDYAKIKLKYLYNERLLFFTDQVLHLIIIAIVVYMYFPYNINLGWFYSDKTLLTVVFLLFVSVVSSIAMKIIVSRWDIDNIRNDKSLENAGAVIGVLERLLIFLFIVIDYWEGIGFLMAAKSIFRFGDLSKSKDRKLTEYILIGTLLSFGMAIGAGLLYNFLLKIL